MKTIDQAQWKSTVAKLWPCLKGSLTLVYKPCIRPNCLACRRGDKHPAWMLSYTEKGKRRCLYVPLPMVATIQRAIQNGRRLEKLLAEMGPLFIHGYRRTLLKATKGKSKS